MGGRQAFFDAAQIDRRRGRSGAEVLAANLAAEGVVLQVVEARSALDIGELLGLGLLRPFKNLTAADRPLELANELFQMVLYHAIQVNQIAVDVVKYLNRCRWAQEIERGTTAKNLDVAFLSRKQRYQPIGQTALAAQPRDNR